MNDLTMNILGFAAVNRDLDVELRDPATQNVVRTVKPFLDGTVRFSKLDPGNYEVLIRHPNLTLPVIRRPIRVLPVGETTVTVVIDPSKFRNSPIEDIPEANLSPVADLARSVGETVAPLAAKTPGEAIRAADWNGLAGAVRDLATTTGELTRLVAPTGHDHPELIAKINEMSTNFQTLLDTLSQAMAELQRQIQTLRLRRQVEDVLDHAAIDITSVKGREFTALVDDLELRVNDSPTAFSRAARNAAVQMSTKVEALIDEQAANPAFVSSEQVKQVNASIDLFKANRSASYDTEINFNRKLDRTMGGGALRVLKRQI